MYEPQFYSAKVEFSLKIRSCFLHVPKEWLSYAKPQKGIYVFKLIYGKNKVFVSCVQSRSSTDTIKINGKFAEKLNLKEHDEVSLQPVTHVTPIEEVSVEPLSFSDWEILHRNAGFIENNLLAQIRIVCLNQVFPVWVNPNIFFTVKVAHIDPISEVGMLESTGYSKVLVIPKERSSCSAVLPSKRSPHLQFQHLRDKVLDTTECTQNETENGYYVYNHSEKFEEQTKSSWNFIKLFSSKPDTKREEDPVDTYSDFVPLDLNMVLRVIPYLRTPQLPLAVQSTTVFINVATYVSLFGDVDVPPCFVAVLRKYAVTVTENKKDKKAANPKVSLDARDSSSSDLSFRQLERDREMDNKQPTFESVCVTVMVVHSKEDDEFNLPASLFYSKDVIVVPKELKKAYNLEVGSLVHLKGVQAKPIMIHSIVVHPLIPLPQQVSDEILLENVKSWAFRTNNLSTYSLSDGTFLSLHLYGQKFDFYITLQDAIDQTLNSSSSSFSVSPSSSLGSEQNISIQKSPRYGYMDFRSFQKMRVKCGRIMVLSTSADRPYLNKPDGLYNAVSSKSIECLGGVTKLADAALKNLELWLKLRPLSYLFNHPVTFNGCILICGPKGVGKSALAYGLCEKLAGYPYDVRVKIIPCLPLKGKRVDTIAKKWDEILHEAVYSQPSLILFEDLDYIASCPVSHEQEVGPDGVYFANVVQLFIRFMNRINSSNSKVAVIVTSLSTHSLHPTLMNIKGRHIFQDVVEIKAPDSNDREEILQSLIRTKPHVSVNSVDLITWSKISSKTEGYVAQDLDSLIDRATHAAWVRMANTGSTSGVILQDEDFEMAMEGFVPSSLQGIPLQVQDPKSWKDVGGLREVKKIVQQIIMWPIKYKQIFKNYSLKAQSNILLYGVPGTGKTLLAGVIAKECGLNFISIKGPEVLSKYIGASEQAIRDLFKRASSARPCILFFDEFDSIAPRRGHDSTGVTDRVVNQLLTQLDGVETLEGVHVLAASSRPELIDRALLRPGRLDKCLLCPLPDESERLEILNCLSSKLPLGENINLEMIAAETEHFSGADLQALLYSANIKALHASQSDSSRKYSISTDDVNYSVGSDNLLYMPSVEDGLTVPSYDEGKKIMQEVSIIKENFCGVMEKRTSNRRSTLHVSITQKQLLQVAHEMKPSVTVEERIRYEKIFKNFEGGVVEPETLSLAEVIKRVTLA